MSLRQTALCLDATKPEPFAASVFGPPVSRDDYFERNVRTQRARVIQAKLDRDAARKAGDHRLADALQLSIDGWFDTLRELGR